MENLMVHRHKLLPVTDSQLANGKSQIETRHGQTTENEQAATETRKTAANGATRSKPFRSELYKETPLG